MFYRRKIILALLQLLGGELEKIRIQKLLFLFSQKKIKSEYDFIPYKYGCYSYSAKADLVTMVKKGILVENENSFIKNSSTDFIKTLKLEDKKNLEEIVGSVASVRIKYKNLSNLKVSPPIYRMI